MLGRALVAVFLVTQVASAGCQTRSATEISASATNTPAPATHAPAMPAEPPPGPAFGPVLSAEHLPPALRALKLGITTLAEARALFPPAPQRTIEESVDATMGGSAELLTETGPNKGLRYGELRIRGEQSGNQLLGELGEDYRWVRLRFAAVPGQERPVLHEIGVAQMANASPAVCEAAAPLARQPAAVEGCPPGFTPNAGTDANSFMICVGSPDGRRAVTITCMGRLLVYELVLAGEQNGSAGGVAPRLAD